VLTKDLRKNGAGIDDFYITLSHCWGGTTKRIGPTEDNLSDFQKGISLASLPQTFRDAIVLARHLDRRVRYIWIDSLCIIQNNKADFLSESAQMYQIYRNSYCNISATAATDSEKGLFSNRKPHQLWEDDINLNVEGIPGQAQAPEQRIQTCRIDNLLFWERNVDDAPVNRRGWVLQERLLAPRVLHFAKTRLHGNAMS